MTTRDKNGRFTTNKEKETVPVVSAVLTNSGLTVMVDDKHYMITDSHGRYTEVVAALRERDYVKVKELMDVAATVSKKTQGRVTIMDGVVLLDGNEIHNALTTRMLQMVDLGLDVEPMMKFMERLESNPSYRSREQLFTFLDKCDLPILPDGTFLAYKSVNNDFMDTHTGKSFFNGVGSVVEMDRSKVDDDPNRTCSAGLHVCSQAYGMYGRKLLHVAVDPADVVSVPNDYINAKMRLCRYKVLREAPEGFKSWEDTPVYAYA
jgi:hypothetical protein